MGPKYDGVEATKYFSLHIPFPNKEDLIVLKESLRNCKYSNKVLMELQLYGDKGQKKLSINRSLKTQKALV